MKMIKLKFKGQSSKFIVFIVIVVSVLLFTGAGFSEQDAKSYRAKGWEAQKKGNLDEAITYYRQATILDPDYAVAYNDLGVVWEAKGNAEKAKEMYLKAIEIEPSYPNSYSNLALFYESQGDYNKAALYWKKRANLGSPDDPYTTLAKSRIEKIASTRGETPPASITTARQYEDLLQKNSKMSQENANLVAELTKLSQINTRLEANIKELSQAKENAEYLRIDLKEVKDKAENASQESLAFKKENLGLRDSVAFLEKNKLDLESKLRQVNDLNNQLEEKNKELYASAQKTQELTKEIEKLKDVSGRTSQEQAVLSNDNTKLCNKIVLLEKEIFEKTKEVQASSRSLQELSDKLEILEEMQLPLEKGNEQLKKDIASLEKEKKVLESDLAKLKADNSKDKQKLDSVYRQLEVRAEEIYAIKSQPIRKENGQLKEKVTLLENTLKDKSAKLYKELGIAYGKAELFNLAIEAYENSLDFNPFDADVHYNLGLLYKHSQDNSQLATLHLRKYLELNSKAKNKKEIEYLIGMLDENRIEQRLKKEGEIKK